MRRVAWVAMEQFDVPFFPGRTLSVAYVRPPTDVSPRREEVLAQSVAVINASMVLDPLLLLAAAYKCLVDQRDGRMKTNNMHSELVFNLSPSAKVSDALRTVGLSEGLCYLLIAAFDLSRDEFVRKVALISPGSAALPLTDLPTNANCDAIRRTFKLDQCDDLLGHCVSLLATKGV